MKNQWDMKSLVRMREYVQSVYACIIRSVRNKNRLEMKKQVCNETALQVLDATGYEINKSCGTK
jgi:hypothetical protein